MVFLMVSRCLWILTDCFIPLSVFGGENTHKLCSAGENQWLVYNYEQCSEVLHKADVQENMDDKMLPPPSHTFLIGCDTLRKGQSITAN